MAVNYASKYSQNVDERFSTGSLTNGIVNGEFDWIGVSTVNVYSIPTSAILKVCFAEAMIERPDGMKDTKEEEQGSKKDVEHRGLDVLFEILRKVVED